MKKIVRIGKYDNTQRSLFCEINFKDGKLSITGVEGPMRNGDCHGACGQIVMHEWNITEYAPGWDAARVEMFRSLWERWHLNDMVAGSPAQEEFLRANPVTYKYPENHYDKACEALAAAGLQPDPNHIHNGKPYRYGSAWLCEELPEYVIEFLASLPETDVTPAWT